MGLHLAPDALGMEFPEFFHYFARKMVQKKVTETLMSFQMMDFGIMHWLGTLIDFAALTEDCDRVDIARAGLTTKTMMVMCKVSGDRHN